MSTLTNVRDSLLSKMGSTVSFRPVNISTFADPSLEAGDLISVSQDGNTYSSPIFDNDITWQGAATGSVTSSGNRERETLSKQKRQEYSTETALRSAIGGVSSKVDEDYTALLQSLEDRIGPVDTRLSNVEVDQKDLIAQTSATISGLKTIGLTITKKSDGSYEKAYASSTLFATIQDAVGKEATAKIEVYAVNTGGKSRTIADINADLVNIDATVTKISNIVNAEDSVISAKSLHADGIGTDVLTVEDVKYVGTDLTSSDGVTHSVLGS